ncbi:cytochrome c oxidase assembly protein [Terrabacter sp. 2YAF2]|uniref:cytochrome c oxidase assembly protein n=1 Tax=Terrabacter sp. 2YAF2 TaxID=3233026 RepID=UPI003F9A697D
MILGARKVDVAASMNPSMWMPMKPPTLGRLLAWHPQPIPLVLALTCLAAIGYGWAVLRLARRGHPWPSVRSAMFGVGVASMVAMTGTAINGYGMAMFSVHMVQHMVLSMVTPLFLLLGRPVTLLLRALPGDSRMRRAVVRLIRSRAARILTSPGFTIPLFVLSLYGLYFTPVFDELMSTWCGHAVMLVHFVVTGLLLFWPILGLDPSPRPLSPPLRLIEAFLPVPFHAFFGVTVMGMTTLLVQTFAHPPRTWHLSPVGDQQLGGSLAWGFTELPNLAVVLIVATTWARASAREARRHDRSEDRSGEADRRAYNEWLSSMPQ